MGAWEKNHGVIASPEETEGRGNLSYYKSGSMENRSLTPGFKFNVHPPSLVKRPKLGMRTSFGGQDVQCLPRRSCSVGGFNVEDRPRSNVQRPTRKSWCQSK